LSELKYHIIYMVGTFLLSGVNFGFDCRKYSFYWLRYYTSQSKTAFWPSMPHLTMTRIGGVMVSVLSSGAVDRGFEHDRVKTKTIKLVFVASLLRTQH